MKKLSVVLIGSFLLIAIASNVQAYTIQAGTGNGILKMSGAAGSTKISFTDSGDVEVGYITDDGDAFFNSVLTTVVESIPWNAPGMTPDGAQCIISSTAVAINSGPLMHTAICTDNDASRLDGQITMPDSWDGGTVTFELQYIQTAADTNVLNSDIKAQCRGAGDTLNGTWGTEIAIDDAAVSGSNIEDHTTSAAVTPDGTCAGGDTLYWSFEIDATGTTTAMATLHIRGIKMEFTKTTGD